MGLVGGRCYMWLYLNYAVYGVTGAVGTREKVAVAVQMI